MNWGSQSMTAPLRRVVVKRPQEAFGTREKIASQWKPLNYLGEPDLDRAAAEHERLVSLLRENGAEVLFLPEDPRTGLDSLYTHDPGIVAEAGAILFQTGKEARRGEGPAMADAVRGWQIPVLGILDGSGLAEGGDMVWLDRKTLLVGHGFRTNESAIRKLRELLDPSGVTVIDFDLPYWSGPGDVLHLMSFVSLLDQDLAVVYRKIMPVPMFQLLQTREIQMIDVADEEYDTLGCNVLAVAPRHALMVEGSPVTRARLESAGCRVQEFSGKEIALKGSGGPTCLTRPVWRQQD